MMHVKKQTVLWLLLGLFFGISVLLTVFTGLSGRMLITVFEGITQTADVVFGNIQSGNWNELQKMVLGQPDLTPYTGEEGSVEKQIYDAYLDSLNWFYPDDFHLQGTLITQTVSVNCLDIVGTTAAISDILEHTSFESDSENRNQILCEAAELVLEDKPPLIQRNITLHFLREEQQWYLVPNNDFQALLSGFTSN